MNRRNAHRIRLGINLARDDLRAIRLGLRPIGPQLLAHAHKLTERAWFVTLHRRSHKIWGSR